MVTATSGATAAGNNRVPVAQQSELDRDAFLKMLIMQLRYQDPMRPMEDREFIAQLAQFSSLEQMQQVNKNLEGFVKGQTAFQAVGLIGRTINATDPETSDQVRGDVQSVRFENGIPLLKVGEHDIPLEYVISIE